MREHEVSWWLPGKMAMEHSTMAVRRVRVLLGNGRGDESPVEETSLL